MACSTVYDGGSARVQGCALATAAAVTAAASATGSTAREREGRGRGARMERIRLSSGELCAMASVVAGTSVRRGRARTTSTRGAA